jgi:hypothetical protein
VRHEDEVLLFCYCFSAKLTCNSVNTEKICSSCRILAKFLYYQKTDLTIMNNNNAEFVKIFTTLATVIK